MQSNHAEGRNRNVIASASRRARAWIKGPWGSVRDIENIHRLAKEGDGHELELELIALARNPVKPALMALALYAPFLAWFAASPFVLASHGMIAFILWSLVGCAAAPWVFEYFLSAIPKRAAGPLWNRTTPLMEAARLGRVESVQVLLPYSDALATNSDGDTALHIALRNGRVAAAHALLAQSDPAKPGRHKETALHIAAENHEEDLVRAMLPRSAPLALNSLDRSAAESARFAKFLSRKEKGEAVASLIEGYLLAQKEKRALETLAAQPIEQKRRSRSL